MTTPAAKRFLSVERCWGRLISPWTMAPTIRGNHRMGDRRRRSGLTRAHAPDQESVINAITLAFRFLQLMAPLRPIDQLDDDPGWSDSQRTKILRAQTLDGATGARKPT